MDNRIVVPKLNAQVYRRGNPIQRAKVELVGQLRIKITYPDGDTVDLGVVSEKIVTLAAINALVGVFQGGSATVIQNFKYHASGTGILSESTNDTTLGTEVETRIAGSQTSISPGNYETAATLVYTSPHSITEHGVFSQQAL